MLRNGVLVKDVSLSSTIGDPTPLFPEDRRQVVLRGRTYVFWTFDRGPFFVLSSDFYGFYNVFFRLSLRNEFLKQTLRVASVGEGGGEPTNYQDLNPPRLHNPVNSLTTNSGHSFEPVQHSYELSKCL